MLLFNHFWPDCPYPVKIYSDDRGESWCEVVAKCARESTEAILLLQEDFFLSAHVHSDLISYGCKLMQSLAAGCARLYPCPGSNFDFGDPLFGSVAFGTQFRISCQAAIWEPGYLYRIVMESMWTTSQASDFENLGSEASNHLEELVLAFKRDVRPWPMEYLCSAITRGQWNPEAKLLCDRLNIPIDMSHRPMLGELPA